MRVDPAIAALRGDRSLQLQAQAAMFAAREAWRKQARVAPLLGDIERYGGGATLESCPALAELFAEGGTARQFALGLCATFARVLAAEPLGQLPFRHAFDGMLSTLLLVRSGTARLSLVAHEPGRYESASVLLSDATRHDAVIAGEACARRTERRADGSFVHQSLRLGDGSRIALELSCQGVFVENVGRRLVSLRLQRNAISPGPVREYSLAEGVLLQQSAGDVRQSRQQMMLALLGRMKRCEATPLIAEIAREEGPEELRWEALREALALDTASGFAALCRIAGAPFDSLAVPAGVLRAQLVEAHPELLVFEAEQCLA